MKHNFIEYDRSEKYIEYKCSNCNILGFRDIGMLEIDIWVYYELNNMHFKPELNNISCEEFIIKNIIE